MARRIRIKPVWNKEPQVQRLARGIVGLAEQLRRAEAERPDEPTTPKEQAS